MAPPAGHAGDADPVAACDLQRASLLHALDRFAIRQRHGVMAAIGGHDQPLCGPVMDSRAASSGQASRRSALAAQMTSFSVTPPALWVVNTTTQRL